VKIIMEIGVQIPSVGNTHDDLIEFTDLRVAQKNSLFESWLTTMRKISTLKLL
jgi:hypothetical protein